LNALLIFIKNPELGKVKTRLAATIGDEKALWVFNQLLEHIHFVSKHVNGQKLLFYSSFIDNSDKWESEVFEKYLQNQSPDLGQRMFSAFEMAQKLGFEKALIVGSDIYEVNTDLLNYGFELLEKSEVVVGPSIDGGYYAIGFNFKTVRNQDFLSEIFLNKTWSHELVGQQALEIINKFKYNCSFLPTLRDIDTEEDLKKNPDLYNIL
jgi:rSAM/selenodomain-associated transferase 1